jgi:cytochrome c5
MQFARGFFLLLAFAVTGCGDSTSNASPQIEANSLKRVPQDPAIAALYQRSCRSCHTVAITGAPLTGDTAAWAPRLEKGMSVMVDSVINGSGGMPPLGLCMDCNAPQFEALIRFMAAEDHQP